VKEKNLEEMRKSLPMILLHNAVGFPGNSLDFDILGEESEKSVQYAEKNGGYVFLITERLDETVSPKDKNIQLYDVGVAAKIKQHMKTSDRVNRISVECFDRFIISDMYRADGKEKGCLLVDLEPYEADEPIEEDEELLKDSKAETIAAMRNLKQAFEVLAQMEGISKETTRLVAEEKDPNKLISRIVYCGCFSTDQNQKILEELETVDALIKTFEFVTDEIQILRLQQTLIHQAEESFEAEKRETILREQISFLTAQLDHPHRESDDEEDIDFIERIEDLQIDDSSRKHLMKEAKNLEKLPAMSQESFVIRNYLDMVFSLPWTYTGKSSMYNPFVRKNYGCEDIEWAEKVLERDHYGLKKVKERIIETLSVQQMKPKGTSNIICLVGPPGTGKTSIAKSIAEATFRKYVRVSLGGVRDEADIRGHRRTYLGAMPGRIINALIQVKSNSPVMLLDEIDKMSNDYKGDPSSALLEVLDSEQNKTFRDHYIEVPFDLSNVMFIATANDLSTVAKPLLDRMEVIELSSYTREEKFHIAKDHLISKQRKEHGLKSSQFKIADDALYEIIDFYTREAGVRNLERTIASLCRKADKIIVKQEAKSLNVTSKKLESLLGSRKYQPDEMIKDDAVGVVNGLAWTAVGGTLLPIEAIALKGKGKIELTGSLGDVMQESAKIAITYAKTKSEEYGYESTFMENSDIHIHAPEGAVPKDGPSAGVTMATAIISALSGKKVRSDVAMTGEITLHGEVLPIGGLREKTTAAYKAGINTVIVPYKNKPDMEEVDDIVKDKMNFVFAKDLNDVLSVALR
jgi:ATP-dependent Lon protease